MTNQNLDSFLEKIMSVRVMQMGGLSAGIIGSSTTEDHVIDNLRMSVAAFAREYSKPNSDRVVLVKLSEGIEGHLRTLQLTNALSEAEVEKLTNDLHILMDQNQTKL